MATLIDTPAVTAPPAGWTANGIYKIDADDLVEGAAASAAFGGLGIDNQPHQQLANRTALLANLITGLAAGFQGLIGPNGWIRFPVYTSPSQQTQFTLQWGQGNFVLSPAAITARTVTLAWPRPFAGGPYAVLAVPALAGYIIQWVRPVTTATQGAFSCQPISQENSVVNFDFAWAAIGV